jgi:hypothetical protein
MGIVKPGIVIKTLTSVENSNMDKLTVMMQDVFGVAPIMLPMTMPMMD